MFWCVVSLYIFARCLYFDELVSKYGTTRKYIKRYYTPKHLIRCLMLSYIFTILRHKTDHIERFHYSFNIFFYVFTVEISFFFSKRISVIAVDLKNK